MIFKIFPIQLIQLSLPHELSGLHSLFQDAIFTDMFLFVLAFLCGVVGIMTANRIHWLPKRSLGIIGCLLLLMGALCGVEMMVNEHEERAIAIIGVGKAFLQLVAIFFYSWLVVPVALNQATEVGTITTLPIGIALLFAVLPYLFGGWFALLTWMASLLQNQIGGYLMVGCVYCVLAGWSTSIVDYRQWTLYETSLVSGFYEQTEESGQGL